MAERKDIDTVLNSMVVCTELGCGGIYAKQQYPPTIHCNLEQPDCKYKHNYLFGSHNTCTFKEGLSPEFNDGKITLQYIEWAKEFHSRCSKLKQELNEEINLIEQKIDPLEKILGE